MTDHLEAARDHLLKSRDDLRRTKLISSVERLARAVGHILDHLEAQQTEASIQRGLDQVAAGETEALGSFAHYADPDPLDESNHADRIDWDGDRWVWCDKCDGFRMDGHGVHESSLGASVAEIDGLCGPLTFAPWPAGMPTTAPQPDKAHGDADEPARPELNVQTGLAKTLHALPVGTVIRADGHAYVHTDAWEWVETVTGQAWTADELAAHRPVWYAIHTPQETE